MNRRKFNSAAASCFASAGLGVVPARSQLVNKYAEDLQNGEFNWFPERSLSGPMLIIVSIPDQKVHVYRNGIRVAASSCSTGKPGHGTPTGVFKILQKDKHHRSSTYSNAPMPNMNRLTWSGIALHAGQLPGYPASHGCVRLPLKFSEMLFSITKLGLTVVIADNKSQPASVVHPGMILGNYARQEFATVDSAVMKNESVASHPSNPVSTSVVVSSHDKSMTIWDNDQIVAQGKVKIKDAGKPLSHHVYTLRGTDKSKESVHWSGVSYGKSDREDLAAEIQRIEAEPAMQEEMRKRMHQGMTLVTTSEPSSNAQRTSNDFVVIDGLF